MLRKKEVVYICIFAKCDYMEKMRLDKSFRIRQFSAPGGFIGPSFGRFTEPPHICALCMLACMYACMYVCMYACVCVYVCTRIYFWVLEETTNQNGTQPIPSAGNPCRTPAGSVGATRTYLGKYLAPIQRIFGAVLGRLSTAYGRAGPF